MPIIDRLDILCSNSPDIITIRRSYTDSYTPFRTVYSSVYVIWLTIVPEQRKFGVASTNFTRSDLLSLESPTKRASCNRMAWCKQICIHGIASDLGRYNIDMIILHIFTILFSINLLFTVSIGYFPGCILICIHYNLKTYLLYFELLTFFFNVWCSGIAEIRF
jgi:hypothetical protein